PAPGAGFPARGPPRPAHRAGRPHRIHGGAVHGRGPAAGRGVLRGHEPRRHHGRAHRRRGRRAALGPPPGRRRRPALLAVTPPIRRCGGPVTAPGGTARCPPPCAGRRRSPARAIDHLAATLLCSAASARCCSIARMCVLRSCRWCSALAVTTQAEIAMTRPTRNATVVSASLRTCVLLM